MKKIVDGIVNKERYAQAKPKIVWILKEGNVDPKDVNDERNICAEFDEDGHKENALAIPTFRKMIYATYGIFNPTTEWKEVPYANAEAYDVVKDIAYININKYPAGSQSNWNDIKQAYNENKEELIQQIASINPDIIIFGNTLQYFETEDLAKIGWNISDDKKQYVGDTHNTAFYIVSSSKLCIHAYHPAYPKISDKIYWEEIKKAFEIWEKSK